uniref:Hydroxyproline O-arabinosyltransferase-like domain-containing protein n=1 Tax=Salix viminalis TaxID=40686 RepID=A0A6N2KHH3_SALVM
MIYQVHHQDQHSWLTRNQDAVERSSSGKKRLFHTAVTASDSVYNTWQCRVMYYWYKKHRDGPNSEMGGFTRILHSGKADKFMEEIPTFIAQPLPAGMDQGYIVLNRPWAFVQWLQKADIKEDYILMAEPDHIIVKPIPNLSKDGLGAAFPFFYIEPKKFESIIRKYFLRIRTSNKDRSHRKLSCHYWEGIS